MKASISFSVTLFLISSAFEHSHCNKQMETIVHVRHLTSILLQCSCQKSVPGKLSEFYLLLNAASKEALQRSARQYASFSEDEGDGTNRRGKIAIETSVSRVHPHFHDRLQKVKAKSLAKKYKRRRFSPHIRILSVETDSQLVFKIFLYSFKIAFVSLIGEKTSRSLHHSPSGGFLQE